MKKIFAAAAIICVFFLLASCGSVKDQVYTEPAAPVQEATAAPVQEALPPQPASAENVAQPESVQTVQQVQSVIAETQPQSVTSTAVQTQNEVQPQLERQELPAQGSFTVEGGGYTVEVLSANTDKDYTGTPVAVVKMNYTNSNSSQNCLGDHVEITVKQNGKKLDGDFLVMDASTFDGLAFNFRSPVSNGGSVRCCSAYPTTSGDPLDVSIKIYNDFNSRSILGSGSGTVTIG